MNIPNINRPLARWTIADVSQIGKDILRESVDLFKVVYPEFDLAICYNNLDPNELNDLRDSGVQLVPQTEDMFPYRLRANDKNIIGEAVGCGWKLCPPRLRINECELWIDNDIIIRKRICHIDH